MTIMVLSKFSLGNERTSCRGFISKNCQTSEYLDPDRSVCTDWKVSFEKDFLSSHFFFVTLGYKCVLIEDCRIFKESSGVMQTGNCSIK